MSQYFEIHTQNPQVRLIKRTAEILLKGGIIIYPTDSSYAIGCRLDNKDGLERIRRIRRLDEDHNFTLICRDISEISTFAKINNEAFRLIKSLTPGPFTFILEATKETPKRLQHSKNKTIGIRLPDDPITEAMVLEIGEPLFSTTLILPDHEAAMSDPEEIRERLQKEVDLVIDAGIITYEPTTIIDLTGEHAEITRQGKGIAHNLH
ncbi:MAG: threonylcarbamoyl-AMP synthase [Methylococcus sp.]|jgi:tRNA threonylcarbamoyl adenosine modification protein (Sua5/YciO/YrdC/YwlC family)|nr:MAG: threonylcarbamoyl-AMP synthase [Methylococcus sp.]